MKTHKKAALLFLTLIFAAFSAILFISCGTKLPASVWITYGVTCFSYAVSVAAILMHARSERSLSALYSYFFFNLAVSIAAAIIKSDSTTAVIIAEIVSSVIWAILIFTFASAGKHTLKSTSEQTFAVEETRRQANRIKLLIGRYMGGKLDLRLESAYDNVRLLPIASIERTPEICSKLDLAVTELEIAVKGENGEAVEEALEKLGNIINKIKTA